MTKCTWYILYLDESIFHQNLGPGQGSRCCDISEERNNAEMWGGEMSRECDIRGKLYY